MKITRARLVSSTLALAAAVTLIGGVPALADGGAPQSCSLDSSSHRGACVAYHDEVARFTAPGPSATGFFDLALDQHAVNHGTDSDGGKTAAPDATAVHGGRGFQSIVSDGLWTGLQTSVSYHPTAAPFTASDQVGWGVTVPEDGGNTYTATGSTYLFNTQQVPFEDTGAHHVIVDNQLSDRPLSIGVTNNVTGLTLTQVGTESTGGMLMDPAGRTAGSTLASGGTNYFGGYRSGNAASTLQATYVVAAPPAGTDPTSPQAVYAGFRVHVNTVVDAADPTLQKSTCTVDAATSMAALNCSVTQGGSNDGQSQVSFTISKP